MKNGPVLFKRFGHHPPNPPVSFSLPYFGRAVSFREDVALIWVSFIRLSCFPNGDKQSREKKTNQKIAGHNKSKLSIQLQCGKSLVCILALTTLRLFDLFEDGTPSSKTNHYQDIVLTEKKVLINHINADTVFNPGEYKLN